jgi:hypothetical protein
MELRTAFGSAPFGAFFHEWEKFEAARSRSWTADVFDAGVLDDVPAELGEAPDPHAAAIPTRASRAKPTRHRVQGLRAAVDLVEHPVPLTVTVVLRQSDRWRSSCPNRPMGRCTGRPSPWRSLYPDRSPKPLRVVRSPRRHVETETTTTVADALPTTAACPAPNEALVPPESLPLNQNSSPTGGRAAGG